MPLNRGAAIHEAPHIPRRIFVRLAHATRQRVERNGPDALRRVFRDKLVEVADQVWKFRSLRTKIGYVLDHVERRGAAFDLKMPPHGDEPPLEAADAFSRQIDHRTLLCLAPGIEGAPGDRAKHVGCEERLSALWRANDAGQSASREKSVDQPCRFGRDHNVIDSNRDEAFCWR